MNLIPAPWNGDYATKKAVLEAWNSDKDFHTADIMSGYGHATNRADLIRMGQAHGITIRYSNLTKVVFIP